MNSLEIPERCGVILLPDSVLFPHGAMPLHIFEPRYRQMLNDVLEGNCMFCVGNLIGSDSSDPATSVAPIGTIGLVRASRESDEGTSNLLLHGIFRIRFDEWLEEKPYPYAAISPVLNTTLPASEEAAYLDRLRRAMNRALSGFPSEVNEQLNETLDRAGDSATCSDAMAQQFIHDPASRQKLLETTEVRARLDFLIQFLKKAGPSV